MKLKNNHIFIRNIVITVITLFFSIILYYLLRGTLSELTPIFIVIILGFLPGFFISNAFSLMLEERSRFGGMLLLIIAIPCYFAFSISWLTVPINISIISIIIGIIPAVLAIFLNQFDILADINRILVKIFLIAVGIFSVYNVIALFTQFSGLVPGFEAIRDTILILVFSGFLFLFVPPHIRGIKASKVFVFGPSKSGKTIFLLGLYNHFIHSIRGHHKEVILSTEDPNSIDKLRIENMLADLEQGKTPGGTRRYDLALYSLIGKKFGIAPVEMRIVDYAGERVSEMSPEQYEASLASLQDSLKMGRDEIEKNIDNVEFLEHLQKKDKETLVRAKEDIIRAHLYKNLISSGKIVFLLDGDYFQEFHDGGRAKLIKIFGYYKRIIDSLDTNKSYAFVVTKSDKLSDLNDVTDNSVIAKEIESEIFSIAIQIDTFKEIENLASDLPIYFYTVSANATLRPHDQSPGSPPDGVVFNQLYPWRFGEIAKFGF